MITNRRNVSITLIRGWDGFIKRCVLRCAENIVTKQATVCDVAEPELFRSSVSCLQNNSRL